MKFMNVQETDKSVIDMRACDEIEVVLFFTDLSTYFLSFGTRSLINQGEYHYDGIAMLIMTMTIVDAALTISYPITNKPVHQ
jgi:hypothetical protein